ncbi:DNA alkylation repair enzyme [compost metagenome]
MKAKEIVAQLEALGDEKMRAQNKKRGAGDNQFGVKMGDIRNIAKKIKTNHELALQLWDTGKNVEARFLAALLIDPKKLSNDEIAKIVTSEKFTHIADWFYSYVIKEYTDKETLRQKWMHSSDVMQARAAWSLTSGCVTRNPELVDIPALLDRIENEMPNAASEVQWTMNSTLAQIGINHPEYRERALSIGEKLGIYRDYPTSKGCTSPFAPIWINEMVRRQE